KPLKSLKKKPPKIKNKDRNSVLDHVRVVLNQHSPLESNEPNENSGVKQRPFKRKRSLNDLEGRGVDKKSKVIKELVSGERTDLPPIPPIEDSMFLEMAECLEYFGDSAIGHCLMKIAKERYLGRYSVGTIRRSVQIMECNKILAAYTWTIRLHELNHMEFPKIKKLHADAFEVYLGAYYLTCGESATCRYLKDLMIPLLDLVIEKVGSNDNNYPKDAYVVASKYFSMEWICDLEPLEK
ncbi:27769_t:CDS:2, partial [Racocetra persica]